MQEQPVRKYYDAWIDGYGSASEPQQPGKILRWAKASEQLPAKSGHYYVHTSLDDRIGCFFHLDSGKWEGDLRGEPGNPEIVLEWIEETEDLSAPASPEQDRFIQGYVCCVVTLLKSHGIETAVSEAFQAGVGRIAKAVKAGCPDYDIEELKKHFK